MSLVSSGLLRSSSRVLASGGGPLCRTASCKRSYRNDGGTSWGHSSGSQVQRSKPPKDAKQDRWGGACIRGQARFGAPPSRHSGSMLADTLAPATIDHVLPHWRTSRGTCILFAASLSGLVAVSLISSKFKYLNMVAHSCWCNAKNP